MKCYDCGMQARPLYKCFKCGNIAGHCSGISRCILCSADMCTKCYNENPTCSDLCDEAVIDMMHPTTFIIRFLQSAFR